MTTMREPGSIFAALEKAVEEAGGVKVAADFLGKSKFTVSHEINPDDDKHKMTVRTLGLLAQRYRLPALAHYFATCAGGIFTPLAQTADPLWAKLTAQAFEDMGKLGAEFFRDLSDGTIDRAEARRLLPLVVEMQSHLATMAGLLRLAIEGEEK